MEIVKYISEINELHKKIDNGLRTTVKWAVKVGKLLIEVKDSIPHGNFMRWIDDNCDFKRTMSQQYILLYKHSNKLPSIGNLQDAYKLIECEEKKEKEKKVIEQTEKIKYRKKHNEKPDNWNRSDDYEWEKRKKDGLERDKRIFDFNNKIKEETDKKEKEKKQGEINSKILNDDIKKALNVESQRIEMYKKFETDGTLSGVFDIINDYLFRIKNESSQIETCQSIIKFCRDKSIQYQANK